MCETFVVVNPAVIDEQGLTWESLRRLEALCRALEDKVAGRPLTLYGLGPDDQAVAFTLGWIETVYFVPELELTRRLRSRNALVEEVLMFVVRYEHFLLTNVYRFLAKERVPFPERLPRPSALVLEFEDRRVVIHQPIVPRPQYFV